jgi:C1A family cysteine protease
MKIAIIAQASIAGALLFSSMTSTVNETDPGDFHEAFTNYISKFGKSYADKAEYLQRYGHFVKKWVKVLAHNAKKDRTYTAGWNHMFDWSEEEFEKTLGLKDFDQIPEDAVHADLSHIKDEDIKYVDWREHGCAVNSVKDQGQCGSCWSFAATGAVEGRWNIANDACIDLSEQQLCDCDRSSINPFLGNMGCKGGRLFAAINWYHTKSHIGATEEEYKYVSGDGSDHLDCQTEEGHSDVHTKGYSFAIDAEKKPDTLKRAIQDGPVGLMIKAGQDAVLQYESGIITEGCKSFPPDHGVLLVGYGYDEELDTEYWLIKNSWGTRWGESGFFRIGLDQCGAVDGPVFSDP